MIIFNNNSRIKLPLSRLMSRCASLFRLRGRHGKKLILWVVGVNRSGKTTVLKMLQQCPRSTLYGEGSPAAYRAYRIKPMAEIASLIDATDKQLILFELANDIQYTERFLNLVPGSRALWMFRGYERVAADAVQKWGGAHKAMMIGIARGVIRHPGQQAMAEAMAEETYAQVVALSDDNMSDEDGAALLWYTRNVLYFQLGLDRDPRVLLVKHESLVVDRCRVGQRISDFVGCAFKPGYVEAIETSHMSGARLASVNPAIRDLCNGLVQRLNERCEQK